MQVSGSSISTSNHRGPVFACVRDILAHFAETAPGREAILAPGRPPVTYSELWNRTKDTIDMLRGLNIGPDDRVAVVLPNGPDAAMAILTVAAGSVCVPLNPGYTPREWQHYFRDLQISALITCDSAGPACRDVASELDIPIVELAFQADEKTGVFQLGGANRGEASGFEAAPNTSDAFILLTSGTSSLPKGVSLSHAAVCRSAYNVGATLALGPVDRLLNILPLFHVHGLVSGVLTALAAGSSVICTQGFDGTKFFGQLKEFSPSWYTAVPAIHRAVLSAACNDSMGAQRCSLRVVRSASSTLPPPLLKGLEQLFEVPVIDTYGMTEAASQIAANPVSKRKLGSVGQPAGCEIMVADDAGRPLPVGGRGEIALRGMTITRGYVNDPAATKSAFRDGWFRTGDLGYLDDEGYLFIVGRIKDIINRGGQKVAPLEVEQVLLSHPDVVDAAVFSVDHPRLGEDVAAAVVLSPAAKTTPHDIRNFAAERLARFKVPGSIRLVPEIPKGPAGKIKRSELAAIFANRESATEKSLGRTINTPRTDLEWQVANIIEELLELPRIGVDEDVLALGADSITIMQILARLRDRLGLELSFRDIFDAPTIAGIAGRAASSMPKTLPTTPDNGQFPSLGDIRPLSILQERMLQIDPELLTLPQFNRLLAYRLQGPLDVAALKHCIAEIVGRHDALRTAFDVSDGKPVCRIAPSIDVDQFFAVEDLAATASVPSIQADTLLIEKARLIAERDALTPFDIDQAPLFRARLLRLGDKSHALLLIVHEIIADGWSIGIFNDELSELYAARCSGRPTQSLKPPPQFSDFVRWQRTWIATDAANVETSYWKDRLQGLSPVFDSHPEDYADDPLDDDVVEEALDLPAALVAQLSTLSHRYGATLFMTLLTAFKTMLGAQTGRNSICVATAVANRTLPGMDRIIGPIANTTLICTQMDRDWSFGDALGRVRNAVLESYVHQKTPFDFVAARLSKAHGIEVAPLSDVLFVLQNAYRTPLKMLGLEAQPLMAGARQPSMPINSKSLNFTLVEVPTGISGICSGKKIMLGQKSLSAWVESYKRILEQAVVNPDIGLRELANVE